MSFNADESIPQTPASSGCQPPDSTAPHGAADPVGTATNGNENHLPYRNGNTPVVSEESTELVIETVPSEEITSDESVSDERDIDDEDVEEITVPTERSVRQQAARARQEEFNFLFAQWRETGDQNLRDRLILSNRSLVSYLARRYSDRGELSEDVMQVGLIGLINALDHFDPSRGVRFATFATPTILGEIRRFFRDKTWGIRVPRRLQEVNQTINSRIEELTQELDRSPSYAEIARALGMPIEDIVEALEMIHVMDPVSIDETLYSGSDDSPTNISDQIGAPDPDLETWGEYAALETALEKLPKNERQVLRLAYFDQHSQVEIARKLQVSQMYVSRLQRKALAHLREAMNDNDN
ncbi:MAG TPA: SigB/SigF/SigG family RNA polymerase sigma factor [Abditibacteriaceae bacterium]